MEDTMISTLESNFAGSAFSSLGLDGRLLTTLSGLGYEEPTPIQRQAIPALLTGRDLVGQAATGTGKTAAFALPLIHMVATRAKRENRPSVLVLAPTRELAVQVSEAVHRYGRALGVSVVPIYGGQAYEQQIRALTRGVDIVVATPGRALDHLERGTLKLDGIKSVVLDEADEMLDMGFLEDIETILKAMPSERQTILFSATLPQRINGIAKRYLNDPIEIRIAKEAAKSSEAPKVRQSAFIIGRNQKPQALGRILDVEDPTAAIIFCRTRTEVDELSDILNGRGYRAEPLHGGMSQAQRERVLKKLKSGTADLVIATDVAARGLDIEQLSHVINYDLPSDPEAYVHRVGRVGRAGREGVALSLVEPREHRLLRNFEQATRQKIELTKIPTLADLRARRLESLKDSLRETIAQGGLDHYRGAVEALANDYDIMDVAMAALKLAQLSENGGDEEESEIFSPPIKSEPRGRREEERGGRSRARPFSSQSGMTKIFIGAGRDLGLRPQDIVGAITGEAGIRGKEVGAIDIGERFTLVDVGAEHAEAVIDAMQSASIKGRKLVVRLDRKPSSMPRAGARSGGSRAR